MRRLTITRTVHYGDDVQSAGNLSCERAGRERYRFRVRDREPPWRKYEPWVVDARDRPVQRAVASPGGDGQRDVLLRRDGRDEGREVLRDAKARPEGDARARATTALLTLPGAFLKPSGAPGILDLPGRSARFLGRRGGVRRGPGSDGDRAAEGSRA